MTNEACKAHASNGEPTRRYVDLGALALRSGREVRIVEYNADSLIIERTEGRHPPIRITIPGALVPDLARAIDLFMSRRREESGER